MADLDQISQAIGVLSANTAEAQRQLGRINEKLDNVERDLTTQRTMMETHITAFEKHIKQDKEWHDDVTPVLDDYRNTKNKAIGVIMVLTMLGAAAWEVLRHFMPWTHGRGA